MRGRLFMASPRWDAPTAEVHVSRSRLAPHAHPAAELHGHALLGTMGTPNAATTQSMSMTTQREPAAIIWFEIGVADLARAEAFYTAVLGSSFRPFEEFDPHNYHIVTTSQGHLGGALVRIEAPAERGAQALGARLYAEVPDLTAAVARATQLGAEEVQPPRVIGSSGGWFAIVADPDGIGRASGARLVP